MPPVVSFAGRRVSTAIPYGSPSRQCTASPVRRSIAGRNAEAAAPDARARTATSARQTSLSVITSGACARMTSTAAATASPV